MNRKHSAIIWQASSIIATTTVITILIGILLSIIIKGLPSININFLLTQSKNFGSAGGIFYQIIGSIILITTAAITALPIALGAALYKTEYLTNPKMKRICNTLLYSLNGVPSVIFGIFGLIIFVNILQTGLSWLIGGIILAMMILPTITIASFQAIQSIPITYRETAQTLGLTQWQTIKQIIAPRALQGAITGLFLGLARAIGETAPIMFIATAYSGVTIPGSILEPVVTLPTHILALAQQASHPKALQNAWGTSLILMILVLILSGIALTYRLRYQNTHQE